MHFRVPLCQSNPFTWSKSVGVGVKISPVAFLGEICTQDFDQYYGNFLWHYFHENRHLTMMSIPIPERTIVFCLSKFPLKLQLEKVVFSLPVLNYHAAFLFVINSYCSSFFSWMIHIKFCIVCKALWDTSRLKVLCTHKLLMLL